VGEVVHALNPDKSKFLLLAHQFQTYLGTCVLWITAGLELTLTPTPKETYV